jgi:hypothetical protein
MLPNIEQENTKKGAEKLTPEQRDEILVKVLESVSTESMKSVSDTSVARIVTDFAKSIELANKDLVENLVDEDKTLLKDVVKEISKLQGKNSEDLKRLGVLAEKILLSADKSGNEKLKGVGERLKESVLQEKFQDANATLTGDQDTFKNRFMRNVTGKTPAEAKVQGTSIFGSVLKDFSYGFRKGLGGSFVKDEERRERIRAKADYENKKVALAESSASDFGKILDSVNSSNTNSPDQDKFETGGGEQTTSLSNPDNKPDAVSRSDIEELKSGIRDTDPAFSRSATDGVDPWETRWSDLMDMLNKIKDCVCSCQCTGDSPVPDIDLPDPRRRPGQRQRARVRGRGTGILAAGAVAAAGLAAGAVGAWDWAKGKLGFGESSVGTPESMPATRTTPNAPANDVTRVPGQAPKTVPGQAPKTVPGQTPSRTLPTPANDPGVKIPPAANDDDRMVEEQKKRVNERPTYQGPETEEKTPPKKPGTAEPSTRTRPNIPPAANDVPSAKPKGGFWSNAWDKVKGATGIGKSGAGKLGAKAAGKSLLKKIPGVSILAGLGFGAQRALQGDFVGAGLEVASGAAGTVPFLGTAASLGIDAGLAARDLNALPGDTPTSAPTSAPRSAPASSLASTAATGAAGAAGATAAKPSMFNRALNRVMGSAKKLPSAASALSNSAGRRLGTAGRFAGRVLGKVALPLAAGMAAYDAYKGFNADEKATTGQKFLNAGRNIASGLTFGLVDSTEEKMASGEYSGSQIKPVGKTAGLETGRNLDGAVIERGTDMTAKSAAPVINVPPPTVIQAPANTQQSPVFGSGRDYINARPTDSTWLRFQEKRAVA